MQFGVGLPLDLPTHLADHKLCLAASLWWAPTLWEGGRHWLIWRARLRRVGRIACPGCMHNLPSL